MIRHIVGLSLLAGLVLPVCAAAQKLPDPNKVAPEYRELAQKRRAEIIRASTCASRAEKEKVPKRDMAAHINRCIEAAEKAERDLAGLKKAD